MKLIKVGFCLAVICLALACKDPVSGGQSNGSSSSGGIPPVLIEDKTKVSFQDIPVDPDSETLFTYSMVNLFYQALLWRAPDFPGADSWVSQARIGNLVGMAIGMVNSNEFKNNISIKSREQIVTHLYEKFFEREIDPSGFDTFVKNKSLKYDQLVAILVTSDEFQSHWNAHQNALRTVKLFYKTFLGRDTDPLGAGFSHDIYSNAIAGAAKLIVKSAEFLQNQMPLGREALVRGWYRTLLGREIDPSGIATFITAQPPLPLEQVAAILVTSDEFNTHMWLAPKPVHADPLLVTEEQLRKFRGDFGGIYIPQLIPKCPEDPDSHVRCYNTAHGLMAGELFTAEYGVYSADQRKLIREAYTTGLGKDGKPRNYTHFPLSVGCTNRRDYRDIFPAVQCDKINDLLHELWDSGIYPVCFLSGDVWPPDISHLDKSLCRIVVPMWEMNDPLNGDTAKINSAISWTRQQFPDALLYVHFTPEHGAGGSPEGEWWQWAVKGGQDKWHSPPLPNPHVAGNLYQSSTWNDVPATLARLVDYTSRLGGGMNGWPGGTDVVLFETDIYIKFWDARTEAQGIAYNNQLTRYLNEPLCENGYCGKLAGFCSGSTIVKQK